MGNETKKKWNKIAYEILKPGETTKAYKTTTTTKHTLAYTHAQIY